MGNSSERLGLRSSEFKTWTFGRLENLSRNESLDRLLEADLATLKISNQKNGRIGKTLHQESTGTKVAVTSLSHRVHHILSNGGTEYNLLCDVCYNGSWTEVTSGYIVRSVRTASKDLKL